MSSLLKSFQLYELNLDRVFKNGTDRFTIPLCKNLITRITFV